MSFVKKKENIDKPINISRQSPSLDVQNKIKEITNLKLVIPSKMNKQQLKLVKNKQVKAAPG